MTIVRRTTPSTFRDAMDRFFDDAAYRTLAWAGSAETRLPLDIMSSEDAVTVEAALPGVRPEDVEITVHQDNLTIGVKAAESAEEEDASRVYREVRRSSGSRTLTLPSGLDVDAARATFENGMLHLEIPRAEQAKPRQIAISTITDGTAPAVAAGAASTEDAQKA